MDKWTIAEIQQAYPHPMASVRPKPQGAYCVGEAVLLCHRLWPESAAEWPGEEDLATGLADLNPALEVPRTDYAVNAADMDVEDTLAYQFAAAITTANDGHDFATAWQWAGEALAWQPGAAVPPPED